MGFDMYLMRVKNEDFAMYVNIYDCRDWEKREKCAEEVGYWGKAYGKAHGLQLWAESEQFDKPYNGEGKLS